MESAGKSVELGGAQARCLLSALVLRAGRPASTEALIDALWGEEPPQTAAKIIQKHVSQLRKRLGSLLVTTDGGSALDLTGVMVDAGEFESMLKRASAAADLREAVRVISAALDLWRGEPYANLFDSPAASAERTRLEELRLAATEDLIEAELELGQASELVGRIEDLLARYPLREAVESPDARLVPLRPSGRGAPRLPTAEEPPGRGTGHRALARGSGAQGADSEPGTRSRRARPPIRAQLRCPTAP